MSIQSEEELIHIIKGKSLEEVEYIFKNNLIESKNLNYFKGTLLYLIDNNISYEIIKFIIEQQQQQQQQQQQRDIDNTEIFYNSIKYNNFNTAKLLLKYGTSIENKTTFNSKNILECLIENKDLNSENLLFILNIKKEATLITSDVLYNLIKLEEIGFLKIILQYKYFDLIFIKNILFAYRNRTVFSTSELQKFISLNNGLINVIDKTSAGDILLLKVVKYNKTDIFKLLFNYVTTNHVIFDINNIINLKNNILFHAVYQNGTEIIKLIMGYANKIKFILPLNKKIEYGNYLLLLATQKQNINIIRLIIAYAEINNIILNINEKNNGGVYPLLVAIKKNKIEIIKLLVEYANSNNIILNINEKDKYGYFPLLVATKNNNIKITKLLIHYAEINSIILNINEKKYEYGNYPLFIATLNNNIEIVNLLMEYANSYNIILNIEEKILKVIIYY